MEDLLCNIDQVKNHKTLSKVISLVQDILPILTKNLAVEKTSKLMEVILNVPICLYFQFLKLFLLMGRHNVTIQIIHVFFKKMSNHFYNTLEKGMHRLINLFTL
jgi:hypothetical protein